MKEYNVKNTWWRWWWVKMVMMKGLQDLHAVKSSRHRQAKTDTHTYTHFFLCQIPTTITLSAHTLIFICILSISWRIPVCIMQFFIHSRIKCLLWASLKYICTAAPVCLIFWKFSLSANRSKERKFSHFTNQKKWISTIWDSTEKSVLRFDKLTVKRP